ncbi:hypothetical protein CPB86DRAFT_800363 [Serendipita vermifera]|nr:hypothetical protein CPB86DRAFT_800363 [Serendipita vermifera]
MLGPIEDKPQGDSLTTPVTVGGPTTTHDEGAQILKSLRASLPSLPSQAATAVLPTAHTDSHHELPPRKPSLSTLTVDPSDSESGITSLGRTSTNTNSVDDEQTPTGDSTEDESDVEIITNATAVPSEYENSTSASVLATEHDGQPASDHVGNGVACRYYNRSRCLKGNSCPFSHAPDLYSLRSHPEGRNVCFYFIYNNKCRFKPEECNYSHKRSDLRWDDLEMARQLGEVLERKKVQHKRKKEEQKVARARDPSALAMAPTNNTTSKAPPPLPSSYPSISKKSEPTAKATTASGTPPTAEPANGSESNNNEPKRRKPNKRPPVPPHAAGVAVQPPRWVVQQQMDRMQLVQPNMMPMPMNPVNPMQVYPYPAYTPYYYHFFQPGMGGTY